MCSERFVHALAAPPDNGGSGSVDQVPGLPIPAIKRGFYLNEVGQVLSSSLQSVRWLQAWQLCAAAMVALIHQQHAPVPSGSKWGVVAVDYQQAGGPALRAANNMVS